MPGVSRRPRIDPHALFAPLAEFGRVALAVSGGPDSLALMLLASAYATATGTRERFIVYAVDHGLRPEAAAEVDFVIAQAQKLGLAARALRWDGEKPTTGIQEAARQVAFHQGRLINIDATVIAQEPKIAPHLHRMKLNIAEALNLNIRRVGVKATTTEGLGFAGRGEGIAAQAVATVGLPP